VKKNAVNLLRLSKRSCQENKENGEYKFIQDDAFDIRR
jgi:hypothetical protein